MRREIGILGPYDRRACAVRMRGILRWIIRHRQDREGAGRQKMLDGDAGMRPLMLHGRDDAGLAVAPFDRADAGGAPQRRVLPVGGGHEPRAELRAIGQPHDSAALIGAGSCRSMTIVDSPAPAQATASSIPLRPPPAMISSASSAIAWRISPPPLAGER